MSITESARPPASPLKLEVVVIPVSDVDRAKQFYVGLGWRLDADFPTGDGFRVIQVTPPGSPCSVIFGRGVSSAEPGSVQGLHLVVSDIEAACADLVRRGAEVSAPFHDAGGVFHRAGTEGRVDGPDPERRSYASFASFSDPDGNGWVLQEVTERLPGRVDTDDAPGTPSTRRTTAYRSAVVEGVRVFYREAGPPDAPTILMLHGFPSSSRMFEPLIPLLADRYRIIAPDYPGFGHSDAPPPGAFAYSFDHIARVMEGLVDALGLTSYTLLVQDYGGPVGFRLALRRPERVDAIIVQNAVAHEEGLGPLWETRKAYWADRAANEERLRANLMSFEATRLRHVGTSPHPERYDPDSWTDEHAFLSRPGQIDIQSELFYDYRTNLAAYPDWQAWMRERQPPLLVLWGRYDPSFTVAGAEAYRRDVPDAEVHILDAGHFALDEACDEVAARIRTFLAKREATRTD